MTPLHHHPRRDIPGDLPREWFHDESVELIVWYKGAAIFGFQFCYDMKDTPKALTISADSPVTHRLIDSGESPLEHKGTPVLSDSIPFDVDEVRSIFRTIAGKIPQPIYNHVEARLEALHPEERS
jgi:hypothetical protein